MKLIFAHQSFSKRFWGAHKRKPQNIFPQSPVVFPNQYEISLTGNELRTTKNYMRKAEAQPTIMSGKNFSNER